MRGLRVGSLWIGIAAVVCAGGVMLRGPSIAQEFVLGEKTLPIDKEIVAMLGEPLAKVFAKFGTPISVFASASATDPHVTLVYDEFGFSIHDKKVIQCSFYLDWPSSVFGVKIGDNAENVVKAIGKPTSDITNADGTEAMFWNIDDKTQFIVTFDKEHNFTGLLVGPK